MNSPGGLVAIESSRFSAYEFPIYVSQMHCLLTYKLQEVRHTYVAGKLIKSRLEAEDYTR
jgi:hypothetical protein